MTKDSGRKPVSIWRVLKAQSVVPLAAIYVMVTDASWPSWWIEAAIAVPVLAAAGAILLDLTTPHPRRQP